MILIDVLEYLLVALHLVLVVEHHRTIYVVSGPLLLVAFTTSTCFTSLLTLSLVDGNILRWRPLLKDGELRVLYLIVELEGVLWEAEEDPEVDEKEVLRQEV